MSCMTRRMTAQARREQLLAIASEEFALNGMHGTSAETIARRADISQPYVFRIFGTKKQLFIECVQNVYRRIIRSFVQSAAGLSGGAALFAMGTTYVELLKDRTLLLVMLHGFAACDDPEIQKTVREEFGELWKTAERLSGVSPERVKRFIAVGMLLNAAAAMDLENFDQPWAAALLTSTPRENW